MTRGSPISPSRPLSRSKPWLGWSSLSSKVTLTEALGSQIMVHFDAGAPKVVTADTKANGIFTLTDEFITKIIAAIAAVGTTVTAEDLFDLSLLKEIYTDNPDLIK